MLHDNYISIKWEEKQIVRVTSLVVQGEETAFQCRGCGFDPWLVNYSLEGLMLKLKLQYFGHMIQRADSLEKTLRLGKIEGRRKKR